MQHLKKTSPLSIKKDHLFYQLKVQPSNFPLPSSKSTTHSFCAAVYLYPVATICFGHVEFAILLQGVESITSTSVFELTLLLHVLFHTQPWQPPLFTETKQRPPSHTPPVRKQKKHCHTCAVGNMQLDKLLLPFKEHHPRIRRRFQFDTVQETGHKHRLLFEQRD